MPDCKIVKIVNRSNSSATVKLQKLEKARFGGDFNKFPSLHKTRVKNVCGFYSRKFENCQYEDNAQGRQKVTHVKKDRRWNMSRKTEGGTCQGRQKVEHVMEDRRPQC